MSHRFLLDTNAVSSIMRHPDGAVAHRFAETPPREACISVVVLAELLYGLERRPSRPLERALRRFRLAVPVLSFEEEDASSYAETCAALERRGIKIGSNDALIAAHALARDLTVITNNTSEFVRVPGLAVEDWSA